MRFLTLSAATAALLPLAQAIGNAIVYNNCSDPIYVWSVGSSIGPGQTLNTGNQYTEQYRQDSQTGGITLKVTRVAGGLNNGSPQTDFAYTYDNNHQIWYDLSDVFGDAFINETIAVIPSDTSCTSIIWDNGVPPQGSQTAVCGGDANIQLTTCYGNE